MLAVLASFEDGSMAWDSFENSETASSAQMCEIRIPDMTTIVRSSHCNNSQEEFGLFGSENKVASFKQGPTILKRALIAMGSSG